MMRTKIWNNLIVAKYKALYLSYFNSCVRSIDRWSNGISAVASSAGISTWWIWEEFPWVWASLFGLAQLIIVVKPFFPYINNQNDLTQTWVFYEKLHLAYEKLWVDAQNKVDQAQLEKNYFELRTREVAQLEQTRHFKVWDVKGIHQKADSEWKTYLAQL